MFNILRAYSNFDPSLGYTQGMNFIVASLLLCLNPENDKYSSNFWPFCFYILSQKKIKIYNKIKLANKVSMVF